MVYVDDFFSQRTDMWSGGGHMLADSPEELHAFAARLGLKRAWFQTKPGRPWHDHYDLTGSRRRLAIQLGAVPLTWREMARRLAEWRKRAAAEGAASELRCEADR